MCSKFYSLQKLNANFNGSFVFNVNTQNVDLLKNPSQSSCKS